MDGNITVFPRATLRIANGSTLMAMGTGPARLRFRVMVGGAVEIANGSRLFTDAFLSEPGTVLSMTRGSVLSARGELNATVGRPQVLDSVIAVTSGEGEDAVLTVNCSSWGDFQRSSISVSAGDGPPGETGRDGRPGGTAVLALGNAQLIGCNLSASAGRGGTGGPAPDDIRRGGSGGAGGKASARLDLSYIFGCRMDILAGAGGAGPDGNAFAPSGARNGGPGGRGGDASLAWKGTNLLLSGSALSLKAGSGGRGGSGGDSALEGSLDGGSGSDGGAGGTALADVTDSGTFTFMDSRFIASAGAGGAGGRFGLASGAGRQGGSGNGGAGGDARLELDISDSFTGTNSTLGALGADGGTGGLGPEAGDGGPGGSAGLNMTINTMSMTARLFLEGSALSARGGRGGDGGRGFATFESGGTPGRGGAGGSSGISVDAEGNIKAGGTAIECEPGAGGDSGEPDRAGAEGLAGLRLSTDQGDLSNCTVSRTIGPLDGEDRWTLVNTHVDSGEHFRISGKATAEEHWVKRVTVKDARGAAIMDGSATVEVRRNGTLLESGRSNSRGEAEFKLLDALYTASGVQYRSYVLSAYDTRGRTSPPISVFWSPEVFIDLVLLDKRGLPGCQFTHPAPGNATIINAAEHVGSNGTRVPYIITGESQDSPQNDEPQIQAVQLRFGGTGPWLDLDTVPRGGRVAWNFTWDIYAWAQGMLGAYPLGIIPLALHARSFNGLFWSDDASRGGTETVVNVTVRLLRLPGPPPEIETTSPARSSAGKTARIDVQSGERVAFDARVVFSNGRQVLRWAWCFDDTGGFREDYSSNLSPAASFSYSADREGEYFFAILKVFDNESSRRVELLRAGVARGEFGYDFDERDGSSSVRIKVLVRAPPEQRPAQAPPYWALAVVAAGAAVGLWLLRARKRK